MLWVRMGFGIWGRNFGEAPLEFPAEGEVIVMDLPLLEPFGMEVL